MNTEYHLHPVRTIPITHFYSYLTMKGEEATPASIVLTSVGNIHKDFNKWLCAESKSQKRAQTPRKRGLRR